MNDKAEPSLKIGRYRHYKGGEYDVISIAQHSETREPLVVYRCLYDGSSWWVRPLAMFCEAVTIDGDVKPRFEFIGDVGNDVGIGIGSSDVS
ncbi:MAG: hypothetical protein ACJAUP_002430 [Cellvibrionaceae bacterium]|jgi:hypothetical protein